MYVCPLNVKINLTKNFTLLSIELLLKAPVQIELNVYILKSQSERHVIERSESNIGCTLKHSLVEQKNNLKWKNTSSFPISIPFLKRNVIHFDSFSLLVSINYKFHLSVLLLQDIVNRMFYSFCYTKIKPSLNLYRF